MVNKKSIREHAGENKMHIVVLSAVTILGGGGSWTLASKDYVDQQTGQIMEFLKCDKLDADIPDLQLELSELQSDPDTTRFEIIEKQREIDKKQELWMNLMCAEILEK